MSRPFWQARGAVLLMDGEAIAYLQRYNKIALPLEDVKRLCACIADALNASARKQAAERDTEEQVRSAASLLPSPPATERTESQ